MGNCLFLRARGWRIDRQVRKKLQIPGGVPGGGMVTGRIEPCITRNVSLIFQSPTSLVCDSALGKLFCRFEPSNLFSLYVQSSLL